MTTPDKTDFIDYINDTFKKYKSDTKKESCDDKKKTEIVKLTPTNSQAFLQAYINENTPYRGLLLYHGLGTGKTFTALNISENMNREVVVLLPAALKSRWFNEFEKTDPSKYARPSNYKALSPQEQKRIDKQIRELIEKKYTFISHNAYNAADQLFALRKKEFTKVNSSGGDDDAFDSGYVYKRIGSLDNKLLIIDEVHNVLTNIISEGSKNGSRIYDMIMNAKNLKILALSGTPNINDPYELAVLFNMLRGPMRVGKDVFTAFPDEYVKFKEYFVDPITSTIRNKNIFQERIVGLVSYIRGQNDSNLEIYPKKIVHEVDIPMSLYQWKVYVKARQKEIEKENRSRSFFGLKTSAPKLKRPFPDASVDFKTASRAACNFVFPEEIPKPSAMKPDETMKQFKERIDETVSQLDKKELVDQLSTYSPKFQYIIDFLNKNKKGLVIVYSEFLTLEGIGIFKKVLELNGYTKYRQDTGRDFHRFIEYSGDIDTTERDTNIAAFTNQDNKEGKNVRILLGTSAMAEGLDLVNIRTIFLMEPFFHNIVLKQVIGRGVRRCSHIELPQKDRTVNVYLLLSTRPEGSNLTFPGNDKMTTDQLLYTKAKQKQKLNNSFLDAMKEIAIDCEINRKLNDEEVECSKCTGNYKGKDMYKPDLKLHMVKGNHNCIKEEISISETIKIDNVEYGIDDKNNLYQLKPTVKKVGRLVNNQAIFDAKGGKKKNNKIYGGNYDLLELINN